MKKVKVGNCRNCFVAIIDWPSQKRIFCSKDCYSIYQSVNPYPHGYKSGKEHFNYTHGLSHSREYKTEYDKNYKIKNKQKILEQERLRYQAKRDRILTKVKEYRVKNSDKIAVASARAKARRKGAEGSYTLEEWNKLKRLYQYMCLCCKQQEPSIKLSVDHIIPISKGGTNYINNIQPLCLNCNIRKFTKSTDYRLFYTDEKE